MDSGNQIEGDQVMEAAAETAIADAGTKGQVFFVEILALAAATALMAVALRRRS